MKRISLVILIIFGITSRSNAEIIVYYMEKFSMIRGSNWEYGIQENWKDTDVNLFVDLDNDRITINNAVGSRYDIVVYHDGEDTRDEFGNKYSVSKYECIDQDGELCYVMILIWEDNDIVKFIANYESGQQAMTGTKTKKRQLK